MIGDELAAGDPLAIVHAATEAEADAAIAELVPAFELSEAFVDAPPLIYKEIT